MKCPFGCTTGELIVVSEVSTTLGCMGLDTNRKTEVFSCSLCNRLVSRYWQWEQLRGGVDRPADVIIPDPPPGPPPERSE